MCIPVSLWGPCPGHRGSTRAQGSGLWAPWPVPSPHSWRAACWHRVTCSGNLGPPGRTQERPPRGDACTPFPTSRGAGRIQGLRTPNRGGPSQARTLSGPGPPCQPSRGPSLRLLPTPATTRGCARPHSRPVGPRTGPQAARPGLRLQRARAVGKPLGRACRPERCGLLTGPGRGPSLSRAAGLARAGAGGGGKSECPPRRRPRLGCGARHREATGKLKQTTGTVRDCEG